MSDYQEERSYGNVTLRRNDKMVWLEVDEFVASFELGALTEMFDESDLAAGGTTRVIAAPPTQYLLFGSGVFGLENVTGGHYRLTWIDRETGEVCSGGTVALGGGDEEFESPIAGEAILVLRRIGR